jgi:sterol desaturase/sphingolipid hydroxylase (fatty acid hydroxylase superfamily)
VAMVHSRFGLLNKAWLPLPLRLILGILLLDFVRYAVHWSYHAVPFLWRFHYVHHSDPDFDLSSGVRAHPVEVALTQGSNLAAVAILAAPPVAVLAAELFSCAQGFFSHANASLPEWLEKPLRWMFVTPDMHRVHHSEEIQEQSRNLGEVFPWWDHLFRTYLKAPAAGQDRMLFGIKGIQNEESLNFTFMLLHPFRQQPQEMALPETPVTKFD